MHKLVRFLLLVTLLLGALIGLARATAIRWWRIPDDDPYLEASIAPTLRGGDWIVLWRLTTPKFGDLVLCPEPSQPDREVLGRIAGLAGQKVGVRGSQAIIDGRRAKDEGSCLVSKFTTIDPRTGEPVEQRCENEALGSRVHPRGNVTTQSRPADSETEVGLGQVFLLSDNRLFPYDSREFGPVERGTCSESVIFRLVGAQGFSDVESRLSLIR